MIVNNAEYVTSVTTKTLFEATSPEIAFAGRSNVGKSSLINLLTGRKKLARSSSEPGRTRMLNYFSVNGGELYFVDLPGYGYAKVSDHAKNAWKGLIEYYLQNAPRLKAVVLIVDLRHEPSDLDLQLAEYLDYYSIPYFVVATKGDKLSKEGRRKAIAVVERAFGAVSGSILVASALSGLGREEILAKLDEYL